VIDKARPRRQGLPGKGEKKEAEVESAPVFPKNVQYARTQRKGAGIAC